MSQRCDFGHRVNCMHQPKAFFFFPQPHAPGHYGHSRGNLAIQRKLTPPSTPQTNPNGQKHCWKWPSLISKAAIVFFLTTKGVVRSDVLTEILIFTDILELVLGLEFGSHAAAWLAGFVGFDKRPNSSGISTWLTHFVCWCVWGGRFLHSSTDSQEQELAKECSINRNWHVQMGPGCNWAGRWG